MNYSFAEYLNQVQTVSAELDTLKDIVDEMVEHFEDMQSTVDTLIENIADVN